jgi:hypothetical protein
VQLADAPVTSYSGGIRGYAATKPARGQRIDPFDPKVIAYSAYLEGRHDAVLAAVGGGQKAYSYHFAFNRFAAELTEGQVAALGGFTYTGACLAAAVVTAPLVDSTAAGMAGASATAVSLCYSTATNGGTPALDPVKVAGPTGGGGTPAPPSAHTRSSPARPGREPGRRQVSSE